MASNPPANCCIEGVLHTGETHGHFETFEGVNLYVTGDPKSEKLLFFCSDIWGIQAKNAQIMADNFAKQGYIVVAPDFFFDDPYIGESPSPESPTDRLWDWLKPHMPDAKFDFAHKVLDHAKQKFSHHLSVAAIGYCYGAALVIHLLGEALVDVGAIAHPTLVTVEALERIQKPLIISAAEIDTVFSAELRAKTEEVLSNIDATYYIELFSGVSHGYAVRGDPDDKWVVTCADRTFASQLWFFNLFHQGAARD